ncbi:hypothetical protein [Pseudoclavibacter sp. RFBA6]|uniref:hypothetical protein n=1 Tax=Pseudoclavibacter sp. RFBA6 TaxID=2080573 RepID=UPI000CE8DFCC|nr:hypothetical protein [Pseudoclavibacter sp. RFBA6]PPG39471.1 hypothetical protein C5C17_11820 [Pseudoclavibacter sp. RFBA6]
MWRFWICNSLTGARIREVFPLDGSWKTIANGVGTGSHSFSLFHEVWLLERAGFTKAVAEAEVRSTWGSLTNPDGAKMAIVVCWDDTPVYAGLIKRRSIDDANGVVTVHHDEIRSLLADRLTHPVGGFGTGTWEISGVDLRSAAYLTILRAMAGRGFRWDVRLRGKSITPGSVQRTIWNFEQQTAEQILTEFQNTDGGPDVHFRPVWNAIDAGLEWDPRLGAPRLSGGIFDFVIGADNDGATNLVTLEDTKKQITGVHVAGKGSEVDMRRGWAAESAPVGDGWLRDVVLPLKHIDSVPSLTAHGKALERAQKYPTRQFTMSVRADGAPSDGTSGPTAADIIPGTALRVLPSSLILADDWLSGYVISVSGDMSMDLSVDFQEVQ